MVDLNVKFLIVSHLPVIMQMPAIMVVKERGEK